MAKNSIRDYSATAGSNTDIQSINIDEGCAASNLNNAVRELMADLKDVSTGTIALESPQADSMTVSGDLTVDTNSLYVDSTNNKVRVGTTSNQVTSYEKMSVSGAGGFKTGDTSVLALWQTKTSGNYMQLFSSGSGTSVATIGVDSNDNLTISGNATNHAGLYFNDINGGGILPMRTNALTDGTVQIGSSLWRFQDLYLSGGVYVGGTANPNYFDDYEEGTWTPSFNLVTVTHTVQYGRYIKIGKMVHCKARIEVSSIDNTDASGIQMTVPISANSAVANGGTGCTFAYDSQNSTMMDGSHADVHGAYVSGTTFAVTNDTGGNMQYAQLTQTSGAFVFAFSYEAA